MKEKKTIDKLFKEQFKDFEATPNDAVWEKIEMELQDKKRKKRRVIPIWWKVAGVAAGLALVFTIANLVLNPSNNETFQNNTIVDENETNLTPTEDNLQSEDQNSNPSTERIDNTSIANTEQNTSEEFNTETNDNNKNTLYKTVGSQDQIVSSKTKGKNNGPDNTKTFERHSNTASNELTNTTESSSKTLANQDKKPIGSDSDPRTVLKKQSELDALIKSTKDSEMSVTDSNSGKAI